MLKDKLKSFAHSDKLIVVVGIIAALLLLFNLGFSAYTLIKENNAVQADMERIEKVEHRLFYLEKELEELKK